jgi:hypothetical protein
MGQYSLSLHAIEQVLESITLDLLASVYRWGLPCSSILDQGNNWCLNFAM